MNKWLVFGGGFLSGIVATFLVLMVIGLGINNSNNGGLIGATYFDEPGETIKERSFEVFQVIQDNAALVRSKEPGSTFYFGQVYLMVNNSGRYYYDDEKIDVPKDCKAVQLGIYRYDAKSGTNKTVPIIGITKK